MGEVIIFIGIVLIAYGIYKFFKGIKLLFSKNKNPYFELHKSQIINDKYYNEYLKTLSDKYPNQVPLDKIKSIEELKLEQQINDLVN